MWCGLSTLSPCCRITLTLRCQVLGYIALAIFTYISFAWLVVGVLGSQQTEHPSLGKVTPKPAYDLALEVLWDAVSGVACAVLWAAISAQEDIAGEEEADRTHS